MIDDKIPRFRAPRIIARRGVFRRSLAAPAAVMLAAASVFTIGQGRPVVAIGPSVAAWTTTPDMSHLLSPDMGVVSFNSGVAPAGPVITVDDSPSQQMQTMDGFGASITDSSASVLYQLSPDAREQAMQSIFKTDVGISMSLVRQPIGSSDFVNGPFYTYDDNGPDPSMANFSIAHDTAQIIPLLQRAVALNPNLKVVATPWGQPKWMKDNNDYVGGHLKTDPGTISAYALYLTKFVQAYQAAGIPIYALTVQNEPQNRTPRGYPGTDMPVATETAVINALGPMLTNAGLVGCPNPPSATCGNVRIISYDHNWVEHPDDIASAQRLGANPELNYASDILNSSAAQWIAGTAYHCYNGDSSAQTTLHNAFQQKGIWLTECSGWHGASDPFPKYFSDTLNWHASHLVIGATQNWAKSVVNWNLALDPLGEPHNNGCGDATGWCTGVLTVNGGSVTRNAEYYTLGHLSKFVQPGAVRIASNDPGNNVHDVAFQNPDGSIALVVHNENTSQQPLGISWHGMTANYTVAASGLSTLTWTSSSVSPPPSPSPPSGGASTFKNVFAGRCVDDQFNSTNNGTPVQLYDCNGTAAQRWTPTSDGTLRVNGKCLDVTNNGKTNGSRVQIWDCFAGPNQQWQISADQIVNVGSGRCLDDTNWNPASGTQLQIWDCSGGNNQRWAASPA